MTDSSNMALPMDRRCAGRRFCGSHCRNISNSKVVAPLQYIIEVIDSRQSMLVPDGRSVDIRSEHR